MISVKILPQLRLPLISQRLYND